MSCTMRGLKSRRRFGEWWIHWKRFIRNRI